MMEDYYCQRRYILNFILKDLFIPILMGHAVVNDDVVVSNGSPPWVPVSACGCLLEGFSGTWGRSQGPKSPWSVPGVYCDP